MVAGVAVALFLVTLIGAIVGLQIAFVRRKRRSLALADDALAERWALPNEPFELTIPASGPIDLILSMHAEDGGKHGGSWGFSATLDAERAPSSAASYREAPEPFRAAVEVHVGAFPPRIDKQRERLQATVLDGLSMGTRLTRKILLLKVPGGQAFVLRGKVVFNGSTRVTSVWIAAHEDARGTNG